MERGKALVTSIPQGNPIAEIQKKMKEIDERFKTWISKQPAPVEIAVSTITSAVQGAGLGALMGSITSDMSSSFPTQPPNQVNPSLKQAQAFTGGPLVQARNFAVMTGVNAGITSAMKRWRGGVEDVQTSMVAAFCSGATFSLVSAGGTNQPANALSSGIFFALIQGGIFKTRRRKRIRQLWNSLGQKFSLPSADENYYVKTKAMLSKLGLQNYEKNFRKGLLTDRTLPLLNDSALRDVKIPPGPRLLILDHIQSDPDVMWRGKR
eukprot:TRINITY_DN2432_c0_g1_i2.p1 TRINITY_DN2432_c0_g1~~TRINITY_DN2432_c0_g1_i2.p1  ORF type:complete len:265 (+),score=46.08 TRINITY_DN2432_c0_g1_i2:283-1077(+)